MKCLVIDRGSFLKMQAYKKQPLSFVLWQGPEKDFCGTLGCPMGKTFCGVFLFFVLFIAKNNTKLNRVFFRR